MSAFPIPSRDQVASMGRTEDQLCNHGSYLSQSGRISHKLPCPRPANNDHQQPLSMYGRRVRQEPQTLAFRHSSGPCPPRTARSLHENPCRGLKQSGASIDAAAVQLQPNQPMASNSLETFVLGPFQQVPRIWTGLWQLSGAAWGSAPASKIRAEMLKYTAQGYTAFGESAPPWIQRCLLGSTN